MISKFAPLRWIILFFLLVLTFSVFFRLSNLVSGWYQNQALVIELKSPACPPDSESCIRRGNLAPVIIWELNASAVNKARKLMESAVHWDPKRSSAWLHLAEIYFSLGDRAQAARSFASASVQPEGRSPLLDEKRYESQLVAAWKSYIEKDWLNAIDHFHLGLFWGGDQPLLEDEQAYLRSIAFFEVSQQDYLRAGVFYLLAGDTQDCIDQLTTAFEKNELNPVNSQRESNAYLYLGRAYLSMQDYTNAKNALLVSLKKKPDNRNSLFWLYNLYLLTGQLEEAQSISEILAGLGPEFRLGLHSSSYHEERIETTPTGWALVGYDLDEDLLEDVHRLNAILWWQSDDGKSPGDGFYQVGPYWLQSQELINLLPNPGMEWGVDQRRLPIGYDREFYGAPVDKLVIASQDLNGVPTHVLKSMNSSDVPNIALASRLIQLDPQQYTLMAGWVWDEGSIANIGRNCWGREFQPGYPYYIGFPKSGERPANTWIHLADFQQIVPGEQAETCEVLLINFLAETPAMWDKLLWAVVQTP